jgi:hypothetical protein
MGFIPTPSMGALAGVRAYSAGAARREGDRLRDAREPLMFMGDLAKRLGIRVTLVSDVERGVVPMPPELRTAWLAAVGLST